MTRARVLPPGAALLLAGCAGHQQSVIDAAGPQAGRIEGLWWFFFWLLWAIFAITILATLWALTRRHRGIEQEPLERTHIPSGETEHSLTRWVGGAVIVTILILFVLLVASITTGKGLAELGPKKQGMAIEVIGNQWWWYVRYLNDDASRIVVTANEIHIPVGRPVMFRLASNDVIHSFWVPNLHGKLDLIPGRLNAEWIEADRPGRWRGQCAEFCGMQHAHMAMWVIADPPAEFEKWMQAQLQPAREPSNPSELRGRGVFLNHACVFCHHIAGTPAAGMVAPDLTHFGSRLTIAAGTVPNTKGNLGGWVVDPQNIKPGNHMAEINIAPQDLDPLLDYLESLK